MQCLLSLLACVHGFMSAVDWLWPCAADARDKYGFLRDAVLALAGGYMVSWVLLIDNVIGALLERNMGFFEMQCLPSLLACTWFLGCC
jgi:hypothetical protein